MLCAYIATCTACTPFYFLFHKYSDQVSRLFFIQTINYYFIEQYGYLWFTILYGLSIWRFAICGSVAYKKISRSLFIYFCNALVYILTLYWCFGPSLYERIDSIMDGYCIDDADQIMNLPKATCKKQSGLRWASDFDTSGHVYLLYVSSLCLWKQLLATFNSKNLVVIPYYIQDQNPEISPEVVIASNRNVLDLQQSLAGDAVAQEGCDEAVQAASYGGWDICHSLCLSYKIAWALTVFLTLFVLITWYLLLIITWVFYHTLIEKVVLLSWSITSSSLILYLFP